MGWWPKDQPKEIRIWLVTEWRRALFPKKGTIVAAVVKRWVLNLATVADCDSLFSGN